MFLNRDFGAYSKTSTCEKWSLSDFYRPLFPTVCLAISTVMCSQVGQSNLWWLNIDALMESQTFAVQPPPAVNVRLIRAQESDPASLFSVCWIKRARPRAHSGMLIQLVKTKHTHVIAPTCQSQTTRCPLRTGRLSVCIQVRTSKPQFPATRFCDFWERLIWKSWHYGHLIETSDASNIKS